MEARERALSRFRLIQPHLEKNQPLQTVAADGKVPFRTAQRWVSQYRKFGLIALARKIRADRGARQVISPKLKAAIEAPALKSPPLPIRSIWRQIRRFAQTIGAPPRYGNVRELIREIPVGLLTLAHRGKRRTVSNLTWLTGGRRRGQTRSGKPIMHNWASAWLERMVKSPGPG